MRNATKLAILVLLACGALLLVLGLMIWTGIGDHERLVAAHVTLGVVLVCVLWFICAVAARAGVPTGTVAFAAAWGVLVVFLGLVQEELVPGDLHWVLQVVHLIISMGAIWWGRRLMTLIRQAGDQRQRPPVVSSVSR